MTARVESGARLHALSTRLRKSVKERLAQAL